MQRTYADIISRVRRIPGFGLMNDDQAMDRIARVLRDICLSIPDISGYRYDDPLEVELNDSGVLTAYPVGKVAQIHSVWLLNSDPAGAGFAVTKRLTETNFASLNNDNPTWPTVSPGTPTKWLPTFKSTGEITVQLHPPISTTVAPATGPYAAGTYDKLVVMCSAISSTITGDDLTSDMDIPVSLYPGWVLEEGLAWLTSIELDPQNEAFYRYMYEEAKAGTKAVVKTMTEYLKDGGGFKGAR